MLHSKNQGEHPTEIEVFGIKNSFDPHLAADLQAGPHVVVLTSQLPSKPV